MNHQENLLNFKPGQLADIRSISQRALANYWADLSGARPFPGFDEFDPGPRLHDPNQLNVWRVEGLGRNLAFRAVSQGSFVAEALKGSFTGKTLAEVTPPMLLSPFAGGSNECVRSGCGVYMTLRTFDAAGHAVDLERLLLPFGDDGQVQYIVASLQLVSVTGTFARRTIAKSFEQSCTVRQALCLSRKAGAAATGVTRGSSAR